MADVIELKITVEDGNGEKTTSEGKNQQLTEQTESAGSGLVDKLGSAVKSGIKTAVGAFGIAKAVEITKQVSDYYVSTISLRTGNSLQQAHVETSLHKFATIKNILTGQWINATISNVQSAIAYDINRNVANASAYDMRVRAGYTANGNR